jgi:hypothetical protein
MLLRKRDPSRWRDVLKLTNLFRGITSCKMKDGSTVLF